MDKDMELSEEEIKQKRKLEEQRKMQRRKEGKVEKQEKRQEENVAEEIEYKKEEGFKIFGISIWRILAYFIIYSIMGFVIETLFGLATKGVLESRKSFLYGPFCAIYGLGAVVMIVSLQRFKKNNFTLFIGGYIVGSVIEYLISLICEFFLHVKWWDYSNQPFNINGRICFSYSLFWGLLAIILLTYVNKKVDRFIDFIKTKVSVKLFNTAITAVIIFLFLDCVVTGFALKIFFTRLVINNQLELQNVESYVKNGKELYNIESIKRISDKFFSNEKMLKTFPNLKLVGKDGDIIYVDSILSNIQPYYIKLFEAKDAKQKYQEIRKQS